MTDGARTTVPVADTVGFALVLPEQWKVLDFDPHTRERSVDRLVKAAIGGGDRTARLRRETALSFRALVHDAADSGAFFGATLTTRTGGLPLSASLLVFGVPLPAGDDGRPIELDEMRVRLTDPAAEDEVLREPLSVVDLPIGRAVRTHARTGAGLRSSDGDEPEVDTVKFYVPVATWDVLVILVFSTPSLPAADAFADLFDLLARTGHWKATQ